MKKIIIASIILTLFNYILGYIYCKTPNPFNWGDGSCIFLWVGSFTGVVAIIGFVNDSYRNVSHWIIVAFVIPTWLYFLGQILLPALTR